MKTTVNKDGSVTTSSEDEGAAPAAPEESEAKVVKAPPKAPAKASSTAEKK